MADYYTLLTNAGIAYETACKAAGTPIKLTQMSVGDGGVGGVYNPDATATALKREVWRGNLNALFQDSANPSWLLAEVTIPPEVGGWYVREAGLWTDTGILYAIIKYPESFKPVLASSGSGKEFYIRAIFETSNAALVTLSIDDTIVKATRAWVASFVAEELAKLDNKQSVRVATTANIALVGAQAVDGVAVVAGDRVLVKNQTQARENGLYVVANGAWVRAKDADSSAKVTPNMIVSVEVGATQADTIWQLITDGVIVVGTTALTFKDITDGFARLFSPSFAGNPTAPTPAQFDSSKSVATTEFVKRAGVEYSGLSSVGASTALTSASIGGVVSASSATPINVTLPPTAGVPHGATIEVVNAGGGGVVTMLPSGSDVLTAQSGLVVPVVLGAGDNAYFVKITGEWRLRGGSVSLKYSAVFSGANWLTQPLFDNGKALATTEFAQRAQGNFAGRVDIGALPATLSASAAGCRIVLAASGTITLPLVASVPTGTNFFLFNTTPGVVTVARQGTDVISAMSVNSLTSVTLQSLSTIVITAGNGQWVVEDGMSALKYAPEFASFWSGSGYQRLPSGAIEQWGSGVTDANGYVYVTFPIPFPNAPRNIVPMHVGSLCLMHAVMGAGLSASGCTLRVQNQSGSAQAGWTVWWRAIGN